MLIDFRNSAYNSKDNQFWSDLRNYESDLETQIITIKIKKAKEIGLSTKISIIIDDSIKDLTNHLKLIMPEDESTKNVVLTIFKNVIENLFK